MHRDEVEYEELKYAYPNPTTGKVSIQLSGDWQNEGNILLTNSLGQTLITEEVKGSGHTFDISHLPNGIYIITVFNEKMVDTYKVYKE